MQTKKTSALTAMYVVGGVAIGAAFGAVAGLLFAPKKGSELRAELDELGHAAREKGELLYARAKDLMPSGRKIEGAVGAAKSAGSELLREAKELLG
jgi:gas vesicle protein